jgi:hypothetical protein
MRRMERAAITDLSTLEKDQYNFAINRLDSIRNLIDNCRDEIWEKLLFNRRDTPIDVAQITTILADYNIDTQCDKNITYDTNRGQFESDFIVPFIMILYEWEDTIISIRRQLLELNVWTEWVDFESMFPSEPTDNELSQLFSSYKWLLTIGQLEKLYYLMNDIFIVDTTKDNFVAAFTRKPIGSFSPIRWREDSTSEVVFFISQLIRMDCVFGSKSRMDYQKLVGCISKTNGNTFDPKSLASSAYKLDYHPADDKKEMINNMINQVRSPSH